MPEILTESFCERCGTRYTFESAAPRKTRRLGQFKTLSKGMKNWVMSDDTSLDEAMAAARSDEEREQTSQQLDAFHSTFNFCMTCRQYTCGNCWNAAEGRCLTCAPHLGHEVLPAPFSDVAPVEPVRIEAEAWPEIDLTTAAADNGNGGHQDADPWGTPGTDLGIEEIDPAARLAFLSGASETPSPVEERAWPAEPAADPLAASAPAEPAPPAPRSTQPGGWSETFFRDARSTEPLAQPVAQPPAEVTPAPAPEPAAADTTATSEPIAAEAAPEPPIVETSEERSSLEGRAATGTNRTSDLLRRFRPGESIDAELEAYEAELERQEASTALDEASAVATQREATHEPEPVAAAPAPEPEPIAATPAPEPEPVVVAASEPVAEPVVPDVVATPEPVAAAPEAEPEPIAAPEAQPEPVAAASEPEPERVAPAPEPEPVAAAPEPAPEPLREDRIEQPTWRIYAPDASQPTATPPPALPTVTPPPANGNGAPQWPVRPDQVDSPAMALLANRGNGSADAGLWAASTREVLADPAGAGRAGAPSGVQPCTNCGLSLSATARFCRRCGTRQA